ncbi:MAG: DUF4956 domain-containing protein [Bacteroidia bacterium]|nr:DUF4956 domain-containing protein [Bacteroidia bacterium]
MPEQLTYLISTSVDPWEVLGRLLLSLLLAGLTRVFYLKMADHPAGSRKLARAFLPLALAMSMLASVFSSSVALALGLVGAMSVVRYRAAIPSLEGLNFLFLTLAIGLGAGTGQGVVTTFAVILILALIALRRWTNGKVLQAHLLEITCPAGHISALHDQFNLILPNYILLEFHAGPQQDKWRLLCHSENLQTIQQLKEALRSISPQVSFNLSDENG